MNKEKDLLSCYDVVNYLQTYYNIEYCSIAWKIGDRWHCPLMLINGKKIFNFTCEQETDDDIVFITYPEIEFEDYIICKMYLYKFMKNYIVDVNIKESIYYAKWMTNRLKQIEFDNLHLAVNKLTHIILDQIDYNKLVSNTLHEEMSTISFNNLFHEIASIINHYHNIKLEYIIDSIEDIVGYYCILKQLIINIIIYIKKELITLFLTRNAKGYSIIVEGEINNDNEFAIIQEPIEDMNLKFIYQLGKFYSCNIYKTMNNCFCINFINSSNV